MNEKQHIPVRRIYVASSWRNALQPSIVVALRAAGHEVYDFRQPIPGNDGFRWSEIDPDWLHWAPETYAKRVLTHPIAARGYAFDKAALDWCDTCVLILPSGRSAHLEAGYAAGQGKRVLVYLHPDRFEPELMYLLCDGFVFDVPGMLQAVEWPGTDYTVFPNQNGMPGGSAQVEGAAT